MQRSLPILLALVVLLAGAVAAADLASEVAWIKDLSGVTVTNTQSSSGKYEQTFLVQSPDRTLRQMGDGLRQRGWTIVKNSDVTAAGASVRSLKAEKGGLRMEVTLQDAGIVCTMDVEVRSGGSSAGSGGGSSPAGGSGNSVGANLTLNDSNQEATYHCNGTAVVINSSNNSLRFTGRCKSIILNGSNNEIRVDATCPRVQLNGSHNDVTWSASANPGAGVGIEDNGAFNEVQKTP